MGSWRAGVRGAGGRQERRPRAVPALLLAAVAVLGGLRGIPAASASTLVPVNGAGSTWAANALAQWAAIARQDGMVVRYQATGSSDGRRQYAVGTVDFGVSELPYGLADNAVVEPPPTGRPYAYVPVAGGGTALAYNLTIGGKQVTQLRLSVTTIARIFTGGIDVWNDPAITAENPGLQLPATMVRPVVRSDGASSSWAFTGWLSRRAGPVWDAYCARAGRVSCGPTSNYPLLPGVVIAQAGSTGVAGYVAQTDNVGTITYVENSYALDARLPTVRVLNAAGYYTGPTTGSVAVGLQAAVLDTDPASTTFLTARTDAAEVASDPRAYPLVGYTYLIVPTTSTPPMTPDKGYTLGRFGGYALCAGQQVLAVLGYSPLNRTIVQAGLDQLARIPGASIGTVTPSNCGNPADAADGSNPLAENAPQPSACAQAGPYQCGTAALPPAGQAVGQTLTTTVPTGGLTLTADTAPVELGTLILNTTNDRFVNATAVLLRPVTITDTRPGQLGYTVSGQILDLTSAAGTINAEDLGWTPSMVGAPPPSVSATEGIPVPPGDGLMPGQITGAGLRTSRTLLRAQAGSPAGTGSIGTVVATATLTLRAPTTTPPGNYTTTLVITAI